MINFKTLAIGLTVASLSTASFAAPEAGKYTIDSTHTSVNFFVNHMGFSELSGRFDDVSGNITIADKGNSNLEITIVTGSVNTNHDKRDEHIRSPDFFNAKQFPEIKFTSTFVASEHDGDSVLNGEVEILGVTKPVKLTLKKIGDGKDPWGSYRVGYKATGVIKRSDFGMNFMIGGVGDEIPFIVQLEATK